MEKNIIISRRNDGSIMLTTIIEQSKLDEILLSLKNFKNRLIFEKEIPKFSVLFFDAFRVKEDFDDLSKPFVNSFYIDMKKAKEIWVDQYRGIRDDVLKSLDVEYMKALEAGNVSKQNEIVSKKQQLRDITDISKLPDDLEKIQKTWPEILGQMPDYLKFS